jgi:single-stranded DNA-binding protein
VIDVLIAGRLFGKPQARTSKNGNDFVTGKLRVSAGEETLFANLITFRERTCAALLALEDGASVAVSGELKVSMYLSKKDGSHRPSLDVTVHEVLTPYHVSRRRRGMNGGESDPADKQSSTPQRSSSPTEDFNDDIPF